MTKIFWGIILGLIIAGFGYYTLSPIFNNIVVDDVLPALEPGGISHLSDTQKSDMMQLLEANKVTPEQMSEEMPKSQVQISQAFAVQDTPLHPASGEVRLVESDGQTIVRFENFKTINGPNLHIYLAKDLEAKEFIDLGPIRGTEGNINYTIPEDVNLADYPYIMHWCVPFSVLFNYVEIQSR